MNTKRLKNASKPMTTEQAKEYREQFPVKNAMRCGICGAPADRFEHLFQCIRHNGHIADLIVGIWSDLEKK